MLRPALFYQNPGLSVSLDKIGTFQPGNISKGFLRTDWDKVSRHRHLLRTQPKLRHTGAQSFGRYSSVQPKTVFYRHDDSQIFLFSAAGYLEPAQNISTEPATADKPVIKSLTQHLNLSARILSEHYTVISFQSNAPLLHLMPQGGMLCLLCGPVASGQAKANCNSIIHHSHLLIIQMAHVLPQTAFVNSPDLFQKNDGILAQPYTASGNIDMGRQPGFSRLAGNGSRNDCRRMAVTRVILYDQHRTGPSLFAANHRRQICIENIAPLHCCFRHVFHAPCIVSCATGKIHM